MPYFLSPSAYMTGQRLVSNAIASEWNRNEEKFLGDKFADCVEVSILHFFNLILYNKGSEKFNIQKLLSKISDEKMKNYMKEFYEKHQHSRHQLNSNDPELRNAWNKIVGNLPKKDDDFYNVYYNRDSRNELSPGLLNMIHVLESVLGNRLEDLVTDDKIKQSIQTSTAYLKKHKDDIDEEYKKHYEQYVKEKINIFLSLFKNEKYAFEVQNFECKGEKSSEKTVNPYDRFFASLEIKGQQEGAESFQFEITANSGHGETNMIGESLLTLSTDSFPDTLVQSIFSDKKLTNEFYKTFCNKEYEIFEKIKSDESYINTIKYLTKKNPYCSGKISPDILTKIEPTFIMSLQENSHPDSQFVTNMGKYRVLCINDEKCFKKLFQDKFRDDALKKIVVSKEYYSLLEDKSIEYFDVKSCIDKIPESCEISVIIILGEQPRQYHLMFKKKLYKIIKENIKGMYYATKEDLYKILLNAEICEGLIVNEDLAQYLRNEIDLDELDLDFDEKQKQNIQEITVRLEDGTEKKIKDLS